MKIVGIHPVEVSDVWTLELELIFKELKNSDLACLSLDSTYKNSYPQQNLSTNTNCHSV